MGGVLVRQVFEEEDKKSMGYASFFTNQRRQLVRSGAALLLLLLFGQQSLRAEDLPSSAHYAPLEAFTPLPLPQPASKTRSAAGAPTADYWQNRADYQIRAAIDPVAKRISATVVITYTNNSPDALDALWLHLNQNIYREDARFRYGGPNLPFSTFGMELRTVEIGQAGRFRAADYSVSDTRMRISLPSQLAGAGHKLLVRVGYSYMVPGPWGGRTGWDKSQGGEIYQIAQWYPRMAVYDDLRGWDTLPDLGNEFYLEFGNFDYYVTAPAEMLVAGSGELLNTREVLTATELQRLAQARRSDATVLIRSRDEAIAQAGRLAGQPSRTWHFHMNNTRDVAFAASAAFVWDAARINLPDGKTALAMSYYPAESGGQAAWGRSTEYLKHAVEDFSRRWSPYPWPVAVNVAGPVAGLEYPGLVFDSVSDASKKLFWITTHEIGHTWFPMIVGFNETRDAWMDEGFNSFIDVYESDTFNHGEYGPKRDSEFAGGGGNPVDEILPLLADPMAPPLLSRADTVSSAYGHRLNYFKSALGLVLLREQILGPERFDHAFRKFIQSWAWKHPTPSDFFRAMESDGGEDLSWWWRGWYLTNSSLDLAVRGVDYVEGDPARGAVVRVANLDKLVMPATLEVRYVDGSAARIHLPVESWIQKAEITITVHGTKQIAAATVDPDHVLPDKDRRNNMASP